jgi:hypothetical protein
VKWTKDFNCILLQCFFNMKLIVWYDFFLLISILNKNNFSIKFFKRQSIFAIDRIIIKSNQNYLNLNASSTNATGEFTLSAHVNILLEMAEPIIIKLILKHFDNGLYVKSFLVVNIDICTFFKATSSNPLFKKVYDFVRQFGKVVKRCPFKKVC